MTSRTSRTPSRRMRTTCRFERLIRTLVVAGALVAPVATGAQQTRPGAVPGAPTRSARGERVHLVLPGETLWSLATRYLGDGHRWEEIVALNRAVVSSARSLEAGTTLRIPAAGAGRTSAPAARAGALPATVANGVSALPARRAGDDGFARFAGRTVFFAERRSAIGSDANVAGGARPVGSADPVGSGRSGGTMAGTARDALVRELIGAPWVAADEEMAGAGRVTHRLEEMAIASGDDARELHLYDRVALRAPRSARASVGSDLLAVVMRRLDGVGLVAIPVGVVRVTQAESADGEAFGRVIAKYGSVEEGVLLVPFPASSVAAVPPDGTASASTTGGGRGDLAGIDGEVLTVMDGALLPTLQHFVLVDAGSGRGVRSGDAVTFFADEASRARGRATDVVARGTVLRASAGGASVLIVQQAQPALRVGTVLRIQTTSR